MSTVYHLVSILFPLKMRLTLERVNIVNLLSHIAGGTPYNTQFKVKTD